MIDKIVKILIFLGFICCNNIIGQVRLINFEASKCNTDINLNNSNLINKIIKVNDSIFQIQTRFITNCIGVNNPKILIYGPIINIEFDEFKTDSLDSNNRLTTDCICSYQVNWNISGLSLDLISNSILLINGQIFDNFDKKQLDKSMISYKLDNRRLINIVDMNKNKQWRHEHEFLDKQIVEFYLDNRLIK